MRKETVENPYLSEEVEDTEIVLMFDDLIIKFAHFHLTTDTQKFCEKRNS